MLALAGRALRTLPVEGSLNRFVAVRTERDVYYPLTATERVRAQVVLHEGVEAPVEEGEIAGRLVFYLGEAEIGRTYLVYVQSVADDRAAAQGLFQRMRDFLSGKSGLTLAGLWTQL